MKRGVFIAPFDELSEPAALVHLAVLAERAGWDGFFLWDHLTYPAPVEAVADPWVSLAAVAAGTQRLRLGPLVTPLARRRPWVFARQAVTLDHLSGGRLVLGFGTGNNERGELVEFGEEAEMRVRAEILDEGLELLQSLTSGEPVDHDGRHFQVRSRPFLPRPVQAPRIPIWIGARWPAARPLIRAARWDGVFPIEIEPAQIAELNEVMTTQRTRGADRCQVIARAEPGDDPQPWSEAGVDWLLTELGPQWQADRTLSPGPTLIAAEETVLAGPR